MDVLPTLRALYHVPSLATPVPDRAVDRFRLLPEAVCERLFAAAPCLYAQIPYNDSGASKGIVHLSEVTVGEHTTAANATEIFAVQHPSSGPSFSFPPVEASSDGGSITEQICSQVLENGGIPHMELDSDNWPRWSSLSHVTLNRGGMARVKTYGDILIPAAPTNILISIKTETTRERLMTSGNRFESVGFGFFNDPNEFKTRDRLPYSVA